MSSHIGSSYIVVCVCVVYAAEIEDDRRRSEGAGGESGKRGGKARALMCTWIVPGCLALSVVHLRWSITLSCTQTQAGTYTHTRTHTKTRFQGHNVASIHHVYVNLKHMYDT